MSKQKNKFSRMSSIIPKVFRYARKPVDFQDLPKNVKFISRLVKIALQKDCWVDGSYMTGENALDSDLDIAVKKLIPKKHKKICDELNEVLGIKIDIIQREHVNNKFKIEL